MNKINRNVIKPIFSLFSKSILYYIPKQTSNIFQNGKRINSGSMMLCRDVTHPLTCFLKMFFKKSNLVTDTIKDKTFPCTWT